MCHLQKVSSGRLPGYEGEKKYPISLVKFSLQAERETTDEGKNFKNCLPLQPDRFTRHEVHVQCLMSANDSGSIVLELRDNNFNCFENTSVSKFSGNDALT